MGPDVGSAGNSDVTTPDIDGVSTPDIDGVSTPDIDRISTTRPGGREGEVAWVDELRGKRGFTPTTVVQWSKGVAPPGQNWYT